jgi:hypothetical protein
MKKRNNEFERFDKTMDALLRISHADLKAKLDAEKKAKQAVNKSKQKRNADKNPGGVQFDK